MTQKGESNHFNVKYLSGYGFSIKVKDSMIELKDNGNPFSEPTIERHFVKSMPYEKIVVSGKGFISTEALHLRVHLQG
jgi:CRISPR-associated protein Cas1